MIRMSGIWRGVWAAACFAAATPLAAQDVPKPDAPVPAPATVPPAEPAAPPPADPTPPVIAHVARPHPASNPEIIELFTAQGCKGCLEADALAGSLTHPGKTLVLTFSVDYWDYLGWRDTWAQPAFADRQRAYQVALKLKDVYTPQAVINGHAEASLLKRPEFDAALAACAKMKKSGPSFIRISGGRVILGGGRHQVAEVWLVRYDPQPREVKITAGENKGQTAKAWNVVRELTRVGLWRGRQSAFRLPTTDETGLKSVILVQASGSGQVLAAHAF